MAGLENFLLQRIESQLALLLSACAPNGANSKARRDSRPPHRLDNELDRRLWCNGRGDPREHCPKNQAR